MKNLTPNLWLIVAIVIMSGCSSLRKADLAAANNPEQAVAEVSQVMQTAQQEQLDILADDEFNQGRTFLADAKKALERDSSSESVLNNAAIAKAFFQDARKTANTRQGSASRILKARASALEAGVRKDDELVKILLEIDEELKSETKQFSRPLEPEDFSELQKRYLVLEGKAVQFSLLNNAKKVIDQAKEDDAEDLAPQSLRTALLDYQTAMNTIAQSPRSPNIYKESVDTALASATQLFDVMNVILGAKGTPEHIAVQIVKQKRALGELTTNLQTAKQTLQEKEGELQRTTGALKSQEQQLARVSMQVRFQQAMDEAQQVLSNDDALVYQQGSKLVFRLKRINFQSGKAVVPESSKDLIASVDGIIKKLDAEKVIVEGHTDSIGSAEVNKRLSQERAAAVANYLYSLRGGYKISYVGFGESHPIAPNETANGRATNRRVDLVLTVKQ